LADAAALGRSRRIFAAELRLATALEALRLSRSVRVAARSAASSWQTHLQLEHPASRVIHLRSVDPDSAEHL
jgi:hypothetical protein